MKDAWEALLTRRSKICNKPGRNFATPLKPEERFLLVEQTGNPMAKSSLDSAWQRFINAAIRDGVIKPEERFSLHGLKHRGVTDTDGNRGDKQDAAGHVSSATTDRYDHQLPVVKPPRRCRIFPKIFPKPQNRHFDSRSSACFYWPTRIRTWNQRIMRKRPLR
ncbi:integrase [Xanthomonas fragariae]|uniref:integrase n=1 Tax=Xanthomonas fragariae TaxID=48664 RepID=UPI000A35CFF5|nr:integrase [Xanthomonas fragariae]SMQ97160.1 phage-related integrase [Xanthomonas fragariae]